MKTVIALLLLPVAGLAQEYLKQINEHRENYINHFLEENSPLQKEDIKYIKFYPADEAYSVEAVFAPATDTSSFDMLTYSGKKK